MMLTELERICKGCKRLVVQFNEKDGLFGQGHVQVIIFDSPKVKGNVLVGKRQVVEIDKIAAAWWGKQE